MTRAFCLLDWRQEELSEGNKDLLCVLGFQCGSLPLRPAS